MAFSPVILIPNKKFTYVHLQPVSVGSKTHIFNIVHTLIVSLSVTQFTTCLFFKNYFFYRNNFENLVFFLSGRISAKNFSVHC